MPGPCPCAGRLRSALHDVERYRQERDDCLTEVKIQEVLAAKAETKRRSALEASHSLTLTMNCSMCLGTGILEGNGSAATRGAQKAHAEEQPSYRAVKVG